jgi:hypothetical protein
MLQNPRIDVDGRTVLVTGTVISYGVQSVDIYPTGTPPYHVRLRFEVDPSRPSNVRTEQLPSAHQTLVHLTNFDSTLGIGTSEPMHIANWMGDGLYLSVLVYIVGEGPSVTRLTSYTVLKGAVRV